MEIGFFIFMAGLTWATHAGLYAYYAPQFREMIHTARFVLLHSLEAAAIFGFGYGLAIKVTGDFVGIEQLVIAGVITALLDGLTFIFFRSYFSGLLSPANIVFPVLAAAGGAYIAITVFS